MKKISFVYFSAAGSTRKVVSVLEACMGRGASEFDLLRERPKGTMQFGADEAVVFAFPVFGGRLPGIAKGMLQHFRGSGTRAAAVVVFGNRAYDDALLELRDALCENGFAVVAAAAFVAEHSIFPVVAHGRPDEADKLKIASFGEACLQKFLAEELVEEVQVKGGRPYMNAAPAAIHPSGDSRCNGCGTCVSICPVGAIPAQNPRKTTTKLCISCTACIAACPQNSRGFHVPIVYSLVQKIFAKGNAKRKEPEVFL